MSRGGRPAVARRRRSCAGGIAVFIALDVFCLHGLLAPFLAQCAGASAVPPVAAASDVFHDEVDHVLKFRLAPWRTSGFTGLYGGYALTQCSLCFTGERGA
jgi:hypothetical protein